MRNRLILLCLFVQFTVIFGLLFAVTQSNVQTVPGDNDIYNASSQAFLDVDPSSLAKEADAAYQKADYEKAAQMYLNLLHYNAKDVNSLYNLACCYGLLGNDALAAVNLKRAVKAGYNDLFHLQQDKDFDKVRNSVVFTSAVDSIKTVLKLKEDPTLTMMYMPGKAYLPVYIHLPNNFNPKRKYYLIIGLHGFGDTAKRFSDLWKGLDQENYIFACPETPYPFYMGNDVGYSWSVMDSLSPAIDMESRQQTDANIAEITRKLQATYKVSDTYLLGFSQGCGLAYTAGILNHELYKGIICCSGWMDFERLSDDQLRAANHLKVAVIHGSEDKVIEFSASDKADQKLISTGYGILYKPFKGGHQISLPDVKNALSWLKK